MDADRLAVELVIETASGVLTGRFGAREAVTILASQAPRARSSATALSARDARWSADHAELLASIRSELAGRLEHGREAPDLRAVVSELDRVVEALARGPVPDTSRHGPSPAGSEGWPA